MAIIRLGSESVAALDKTAERRNMLVYLMNNVLVPGGIKEEYGDKIMFGDYAVIPKCGPKPILLKSGAEKLAQAGNYDMQIEISHQQIGPEFVHYQVTATARHKKEIKAQHIAIANSEEKSIKSAMGTQGATPLGWCHNILCRAEKRAFTGCMIRAWAATAFFNSEQFGMDFLSSDNGADGEAELANEMLTIEVEPIDLVQGIKELVAEISNATGISFDQLRNLAQANNLPSSSSDMHWDQAKELQRLALAQWTKRSYVGLPIDRAFAIIDRLPTGSPMMQVGVIKSELEGWAPPPGAQPKAVTHNGLSVE